MKKHYEGTQRLRTFIVSKTNYKGCIFEVQNSYYK